MSTSQMSASQFMLVSSFMSLKKKLTTAGSVKEYCRVYTNLQDKNNIRQLSVNMYITNSYTVNKI